MSEPLDVTLRGLASGSAKTYLGTQPQEDVVLLARLHVQRWHIQAKAFPGVRGGVCTCSVGLQAPIGNAF